MAVKGGSGRERALTVKTKFEANRFSEARVVDAYQRLVPIVRRTVSGVRDTNATTDGDRPADQAVGKR